MIVFTPRAGRQVRDLREHYEARDRPEAIRALIDALESAWQAIIADPAVGLAAPRPYPQLARPGRAWVKAGRYWVAYGRANPAVIIAVFHESCRHSRPNRRLIIDGLECLTPAGSHLQAGSAPLADPGLPPHLRFTCQDFPR